MKRRSLLVAVALLAITSVYRSQAQTKTDSADVIVKAVQKWVEKAGFDASKETNSNGDIVRYDVKKRYSISSGGEYDVIKIVETDTSERKLTRRDGSERITNEIGTLTYTFRCSSLYYSCILSMNKRNLYHAYTGNVSGRTIYVADISSDDAVFGKAFRYEANGTVYNEGLYTQYVRKFSIEFEKEEDCTGFMHAMRDFMRKRDGE